MDLEPSQLDSIKIAPVGTYAFAIEKEELGSVSFGEDPATVQAESALIGAAATYELNRRELARVRALGPANGVAEKELEQAAADEESAAAALKAARAAGRALGRTDAEIDRMVAAGKIESAPAPARWVLAEVLESDCALIRVGQPVKVKVPAYPNRVFTGRVSRIYATLDPALHRLPVRCRVGDPRHELRPGMLASVAIEVHPPVVSVALPADGVVREGDGTMTAWVTADRRRFTQRVVTTGLRENGRVQILAGLKVGELAVTDGAIFLDNMLQAPTGD